MAAVGEVERQAHERWSGGAIAAARRAVAARELRVAEEWPVIEGPAPPSEPVPPPRVRAVEVVTDPAAWRLAVLPTALLPVVLVPLLGLPAAAAPALLPPAVGLGALVLVVVARARHAAVHRARLRRFADVLVAAARERIDADAGRRLLELEGTVTTHAEERAIRLRADVDQLPDHTGGLRCVPLTPAPTSPVTVTVTRASLPQPVGRAGPGARATATGPSRTPRSRGSTWAAASTATTTACPTPCSPTTAPTC